MTIGDRIFELLRERGMSQKEFSERTDIAQSTISDWKRKGTNPIAEKILIISQVLEVTPEELLSGADIVGTRSREEVSYMIGRDTELGRFITDYQSLNEGQKNRLKGYMEAMKNLK